MKRVIHIAKWKLKSCPRCNGDMFFDRDLYNWIEQCIQCGYARDLRSTVNLGQQQAGSGEEKEKRVTVLSKG